MIDSLNFWISGKSSSFNSSNLAILSSIMEFFMAGSVAKVWLYLIIFVVLTKFTKGLFSERIRS